MSALSKMTAGDVLAAHINQFFQLDDERQKTMLASLSAYAGNSKQRDVPAPVTGGKKGRHVADVPMLSATMPTDANSMTSSKKTVRTTPVALEPMKIMIGEPATPMPTPASLLLPQGPSGDPWQKVVQELGSNVPKGTTIVMQDLLSQAGAWDSKLWGQNETPQTTPHAQGHNHKMAAVRWLKQHLEKQQEASVEKLRNIMAHACSGDGSAGIHVPEQTSLSLPYMQHPVHGSVPCSYPTKLEVKLSVGASAGHGFSVQRNPLPLQAAHTWVVRHQSVELCLLLRLQIMDSWQRWFGTELMDSPCKNTFSKMFQIQAGNLISTYDTQAR